MSDHDDASQAAEPPSPHPPEAVLEAARAIGRLMARRLLSGRDPSGSPQGRSPDLLPP